MKFSKSLLASAIALTMTQGANANWTSSAVIKNETAVFSQGGSVTGNYTTEVYQGAVGAGQMTGGDAVTHNSGDAMKSETSARIFLNGEFDNGNTAHIELRPVYDSEAANSDYEGHQSYTQQDFLREAYIDTTTEDGTYIRLGKQQIVWGKADGAKFMDLINPTDYREMAQNAMDESRITVWGLNAEKILEDGSTVQLTVTQPKENVFAGLNRNISTAVRGNDDLTGGDNTINNGTDAGHPFILMGPDTITGQKNGFLNIVPDLGAVAFSFAGGFGGIANLHAASMALFTVGAVDGNSNTFADFRMDEMSGAILNAAPADYNAGGIPANFQASIENVAWALSAAGNKGANFAAWAVNDAAGALAGANAVTGAQMLEFGFGSQYNTNLADYEVDAAGAAAVATQVQDSAFDYMAGTTFATFDSFVNAKSQYIYDMPDDTDVDLGMKWSKSFSNGLNASFAYSYNYDKNPIINLSWRDVNGNLLFENRASFNDGVDNTSGFDAATFGAGVYANGSDDYLVPDATSGNVIVLTNEQGDLGALWNLDAAQQADLGVGYDATDYDGANYGGAAIAAGAGTEYATMRFTQSVERVHNIAAGFDYALDTENLGPVVLRGEFVYTKDGYQPVINKDLLNIGALASALTMEKADRFKYVLGADVTVLTDMMVSAQFIQDRNLDFVDNANHYTTAYASMHMSNGFIKDFENKEFYSLFFSKPFGESGEGRWNNITMLEEGGGHWNRFDVEYSLSNDVIGTFEINKYWGDANSQFGQLENSSNVQVGLKYIIE